MPGPVINGHADVETECGQCHVAFSRDRQRDLCLACHEAVAADLQAGQGFHGRDPAASADKCASCHTEHEGRNMRIVELDASSFDHELTDFVLHGSHSSAECEDCHTAGAKHREAPQLCYACHQEDDDHGGGLGEDCADCHTAAGWKDTQFEHEQRTGYALFGGHEGLECAGCHRNDAYVDTPTDCYSCHVDDDPHEGLNGNDCAYCHTVRGWSEILFDHALQTRFPLSGRHQDIACTDCHESSRFEDRPARECIACHRRDDEHDGLNGTACGDCHTASSWSITTFDHAVDTAFPLHGAHLQIECADCHSAPVPETSPPATCFGCHSADDPHAGQEGEDCGLCHNEADWTGRVAFDHGLTAFPLIGRHQEADCESCHESRRFRDAPLRCVECHADEDVHAGGVGPACSNCHNPGGWSFWSFDHAAQTGFALDGAHADLLCASCHDRPLAEQRLEAGSCLSCHRADDVHRGEFGSDCGRCHDTRSFSGARREP